MTSEVFKFKEKVWLHSTPTATWYFVSIPKKESEYIGERFASQKGGFGSIRVTATIGMTEWRTSIFPDSKKKGTYFLLLNAEVRKREKITDGDAIEFTIDI